MITIIKITNISYFGKTLPTFEVDLSKKHEPSE